MDFNFLDENEALREAFERGERFPTTWYQHTPLQRVLQNLKEKNLLHISFYYLTIAKHRRKSKKKTTFSIDFELIKIQ